MSKKLRYLEPHPDLLHIQSGQEFGPNIRFIPAAAGALCRAFSACQQKYSS
jgi:hypothetical protein